MLKKLLNNSFFLSVFSGISVFLAYECFNILPLVLLFPVFYNLLLFNVDSSKKAFWFGFLTSFVIMVGGFYWVIYVLHEFGYVPWSVASLLYLGFCGFGALNFPLFAFFSYKIIEHSKLKLDSKFSNTFFIPFFLPALFTFIEYGIPKLFPWYLGHSLYKMTYLIQIVEITGCSFLTFLLYQTGSILQVRYTSGSFPKLASLTCLILWCSTLIFSNFRIHNLNIETRPYQTLLVQANIGSLEKVEAEKGISGKVTYVVNQYKKLTHEALAKKPADLVLWPETAMPFQMDSDNHFVRDVKEFISKQNTNFIIGGYGKGARYWDRDTNSAFYFPKGAATYETRFNKMILLPFGEFLPFGETLPFLYSWFPQVANFERGESQAPFTFKDGTRVGATICYEDIVPDFYRKTASYLPNLIVNVTNDSWFGPTSEPYLHASLTNFRAIESRIPLLRVTNTGISFVVDILGRIHGATGTFEEGVVDQTVDIPVNPHKTIYVEYGDWFIILLGILLGASAWRIKNASLSA